MPNNPGANPLAKRVLGAVVALALAAAVYYGLISQQTANTVQTQADQTLNGAPAQPAPPQAPAPQSTSPQAPAPQPASPSQPAPAGTR